VVVAAHIEQWARTQTDDLTNGLALSKTAHWMFDEGVWSADNDLRVIVNARRFSENGPEPLRLLSFVGRHLQFDPSAKLRPSVEYLGNQRTHHGW
jgi:putative restriction endonuclease